VAIGIASSDANQKIAEIAYELLYFYMHLCYLTVFKTLGDEKATLFVYTAVSTIIRQRYRGEEIEMLPQFMQYVLNSKGIDLLTQYEINHRQPGMFEIKLR